MDIVFCGAVTGRPGDTDFSQRGTLTPHPLDPSRYICSWFDKGGLALSIQPDGSFGTRPAGTSSPFETFAFDGSSLALVPNWDWANNRPAIGDQPGLTTRGYVILAKRVHG